ncbi:MAG: ABC transporter permease [Bryobacteraceae bacterium]
MNLWQDGRYAGRKLLKAPAFAITAIITMALGIGVTTAIFSVCDALLWRPAPLPHLERLVMVMQEIPGELNDWNPASPADVDALRDENRTLENLASWQEGLANLSGSGEPDRVVQAMVTANFFDVADIQPVRGRAFQAGEDQPGREREVILSDGFWRRRFGADPQIIGKPVRVDDQAYTVIGVMPPGFAFPLATEIWTPLALTAAQRSSRSTQVLESMGRLKPGKTMQEAAAEINGIAARLEKAYPETNKGRRFLVWPSLKFLVDRETQQYLVMLLGSVLFVLLIACVNVANLQFARATGRSREVAVRRALGAGRSRIIVQLVMESVLLALVGAGFGLLVAKWGMGSIRGAMPPEIQRYILGWSDIHLEGRALFFTMAAALVSGVIAGLAPAWQCSQPNLTDALKEGGRSSSTGKGRQRLRHGLVAAEIALSAVLLVGASLMVRGFQTLLKNGAALEPSTLLTLRLAITDQKYREPYQEASFYREVIERIKALPGVRNVAAVSALPYSDHSSRRLFVIEGRQVEPGKQPSGMYQVASPEYFSTLHVPLRQGRVLSESDREQALRVALISERMAKRWWPNESPIGRRIKIGEVDSKNPWTTIVGVVGDVTHNAYDREPRATIYVPYRQAPALWMDVGVRTIGDPLKLASAVTAAIHSVDPEQPITDMRTMEKAIHNSAIGLNYMAALMGVFGGIALLLSAIGVYGVMAYLVSEQTQEIGIRMALGAMPGNLLQAIFRRGLLTVGIGLATGLPLAYLLARLMASLIYGVAANDLATFVGIPMALAAAAVLAIYIPARRATKIDPIFALRSE